MSPNSCTCPPDGCHTDPDDPDSIVCSDYGCGVCLHGSSARWIPAIPELAAVLDPTRPEPTAEQVEQARAELEYAATRARSRTGGER